jgi:uncharacterized protein (UPF0128 family)
MTHTLLLRNDNRHITYWESKWDREVGDIINVDGIKYKVVDLLKNKDEARMTFTFLRGTQLFERYKSLFF